jgi:hypothetical protein
MLATLVAARAFAGDPPIDIRTRETALAATIDLEFQDALAKGVSGSVLLEQDGKVALRAGYGFVDDTKTAPFTVETLQPSTAVIPSASVESVYSWYRSAAFVRSGMTAAGWETRKDDAGHIVQISHKDIAAAHLEYFCWRPDDGVFLYVVANGGEKETTRLLNRAMTSVRDYGHMPVTDMH